MAVSKVVYGGETLIDLSGDTVDAAHLASGYTAHDRAGNAVVGTMESGGATEPYVEEVFDSDGLLIGANFHGYTSIRCSMFRQAYTLTSITLPDGITRIMDDAFSMCYSLESITLPDGITKLGNGVFSYCYGLTSITLPDSITDIGSSIFTDCTSLTSLVLPNGLNKIYYRTCYNCTALSTVEFKGTPTHIESQAFELCNNLTTINVPWSEGAVANAPWGATNATINYNYTGV